MMRELGDVGVLIHSRQAVRDYRWNGVLVFEKNLWLLHKAEEEENLLVLCNAKTSEELEL
jgi:hypothetical protein